MTGHPAAPDVYPAMTADGVHPITSALAGEIAKNEHYLHRKPQITHAFGLVRDMNVVGIITFGPPASRHVQIGAYRDDPNVVIELNRMWVHDDMPRNTESAFIARALAQMPRHIVVSYADTAWGHVGTVYRAANFHYAGWTDMDRKTPRFDYIPVNGGHSRNAYRAAGGGIKEKVRRKPKVKYWTTTGTPTDRKALTARCGWPRMDWKTTPPPTPQAATAIHQLLTSPAPAGHFS